ncbi:MAG TPA: DUF5134 domain-containing protein [Mycobacterium sp.]|nr:DUF5134 domain-containing protein [Mycobacterium sp.]
MIADLALRWVVTILFTVTAAECALALVARRHHRAAVIGHAFHLAMSVAMAVMAWPRGAALPTTAPMVFFLAGAGWFLAVTLVVAATTTARLVNGYHTLMMVAMAWMYAVMNGTLLTGQPDSGSTGGQGGHSGHAGHSRGGGMDMPAADMATEHTSGSPVWIPPINWIWTVGFAVAAVFWLYQYFAARRLEGGPITLRHFGTLCQSLMAAGMAIMFGVML